MELADVLDSKSSGGDTVRVRPPLPAPRLHILKDATPKKPRNSGVFWRSRGQKRTVTAWRVLGDATLIFGIWTCVVDKKRVRAEEKQNTFWEGPERNLVLFLRSKGKRKEWAWSAQIYRKQNRPGLWRLWWKRCSFCLSTQWYRIPGFQRDPPEAGIIQKDMKQKKQQKGAGKNDLPKR